MSIKNDFITLAKPLIEDKKVQQMNAFIQHGNTNCLSHCIAVAYVSFSLARKLHIRCDETSLIRGALLHDYFLYDWHEKNAGHQWHGFHHAKKALENASRDFDLTHIEKDIIGKHMFPLNITPPRYRESYLVTIADKVCSLYETISGHPWFAIET